VSLLPGDVNYVDTAMPGQTLAPVYEINSNAPAVIEATIREHETRIKTAYYADLWLMLSQADGEMTAREVVERREEKLLQLGTVLERLQNELLNPLVDRVFGILQRRGKLPKAPPELSGKPLRVEYISIMAQAQKLLGTTGIERLAGFIGQVAAVKPEILDKFDVDATVDEYSEMLGVPAGIVRTDEEVATIRAQRQQMAQQQQQAAQMQQAAETAKTASQADTEGNNALTTMLQAMGAK
jgi:methyl-accepting chemotaxis protein